MSKRPKLPSCLQHWPKRGLELAENIVRGFKTQETQNHIVDAVPNCRPDSLVKGNFGRDHPPIVEWEKSLQNVVIIVGKRSMKCESNKARSEHACPIKIKKRFPFITLQAHISHRVDNATDHHFSKHRMCLQSLFISIPVMLWGIPQDFIKGPSLPILMINRKQLSDGKSTGT
nr:hypothetical protein Iba_scaffold27076CG0010 [Ipomoea batatas]